MVVLLISFVSGLTWSMEVFFIFLIFFVPCVLFVCRPGSFMATEPFGVRWSLDRVAISMLEWCIAMSSHNGANTLVAYPLNVLPTAWCPQTPTLRPS